MKTIYLKSDTNSWTSMEAVARACKGAGVKISGTTLDLNGCRLDGRKLPQPDNEDDEGAVPLRISIKGFTMKNGSVRGIPGGIIFRRDGCTFQDLDFTGIGEDALSNIMDDSANSTVRRCTFRGASDKSAQWNDARGATVEDCQFYGGETGVRLQKKGGKYKTPRTKSIRNNLFVDCRTAWNISGEIQVVASGNTYRDVGQRVVANTGAKFTGT